MAHRNLDIRRLHAANGLPDASDPCNLILGHAFLRDLICGKGSGEPLKHPLIGALNALQAHRVELLWDKPDARCIVSPTRHEIGLIQNRHARTDDLLGPVRIDRE